MAELQLSVVSDLSGKHQIESQIMQWEDNLERLHCEQFRLRCYMASLQNGELPNPKVRCLLIVPLLFCLPPKGTPPTHDTKKDKK
jgi:hypothetical protein